MNEFVNFCREIYISNKERLKTPFYSFYVVILILWNWDVLSYYFLDNKAISDRIWIIKTIYSGWDRIFYPLGYAILLAMVFPFLISGMELLLQFPNDWRRNVRYNAAAKIRKENIRKAHHDFLIEQEKNGRTEIEDYNKNLEELRSQLIIQREQYDESKKFYETTIADQKNLITEKDKANTKLRKDLTAIQLIQNREFTVGDITSIINILTSTRLISEEGLLTFLKYIQDSQVVVNATIIQRHFERMGIAISRTDILELLKMLRGLQILIQSGNLTRLSSLGEQVVRTLEKLSPESDTSLRFR